MFYSLSYFPSSSFNLMGNKPTFQGTLLSLKVGSGGEARGGAGREPASALNVPTVALPYHCLCRPMFLCFVFCCLIAQTAYASVAVVVPSTAWSCFFLFFLQFVILRTTIFHRCWLLSAIWWVFYFLFFLVCFFYSKRSLFFSNLSKCKVLGDPNGLKSLG